MKMTWKLIVASLALAGTANAAESRSVDLNSLSPDPMMVLDALVPGRSKDKDHHNKKEMPQACKDANITDAQKTQIEAAVYDSVREKIQLKADIKLAFMAYGRTVTDPASDKAAGEAAGAAILDAATKLGNNHLALSNKILYDIVDADQRKNTFMCMMMMHKMEKGHKKGHH